MERMIRSIRGSRNVGTGNIEVDNSEMEVFCGCIDRMFSKVNEFEQRVDAVERYYADNKELNTAKCSSILKDKIKKKHLMTVEKQQQDSEKLTQDLMRQFAAIFRQITQHKWAWPFLEPVDVEGLCLHDYYEVIEKPMDFSTIKNRMEAKDGTGYKNVREIYADVRLVFKNAMKYNDERDDVHVMARTLLEKFEEKWLPLLPKVAEEEKRREKEQTATQVATKLAEEASYANMAQDLSNEVCETSEPFCNSLFNGRRCFFFFLHTLDDVPLLNCLILYKNISVTWVEQYMLNFCQLHGVDMQLERIREMVVRNSRFVQQPMFSFLLYNFELNFYWFR
ncbi:hypothetical protein H0E87_003086 [Populus deltoides]|uniref:Bromo domain-containing protein n=1 Tax=Populus deltoides TaxID=3696 RepID=A0A8T2ZYA3_POPDE|nr:hypothetical protein H0E87_003086 [Populus deltoides]